MPSPNAIFTELVTTTYRNHRSKLIDNVTRNNAFSAYLKRKQRFRTEDGGTTITVPLEYAENTTYQRFSGFDVLNVAQSDVFTSAEFQWRQIALHVVASGRELLINKGSSRIINLAKSRLKNAMNTYRNQFSQDLYSDGTLANQIGGLQQLVSDAGTGLVGGIDASTWPFWRNIVQSAAAPLQGGAGITPGPTTMESLMLPLYLELVRGNDQIDLIVSSNDYFQFYELSQVAIKRYTSDGTSAGSATGGFNSLKYKTADVIFDGNSGIPPSHMYFMNTDYFEICAHPDADMTIQDEVKPYNQNAVVIPILWMGNTTISNRRLQGVLRP